jgi:hypothetical protein
VRGGIYIGGEREINDPLPVRRKVREPVVVGIKGNLLLTGTIRLHAPDLHRAGADRVEIDPFAIRAEFRAVVQRRIVRQIGFLFRVHVDGPYVPLAVAVTGEKDVFPIHRP